MVSPLKLWKHPQPKRLWPALGTLSVLAHVGALGLSLPYVLDLMQSEGAATAAAAVPIELVVVEAEDIPEGASSVHSSSQQARSAPTASEPTPSKAGADSRSSTRPAAIKAPDARSAIANASDSVSSIEPADRATEQTDQVKSTESTSSSASSTSIPPENELDSESLDSESEEASNDSTSSPSEPNQPEPNQPKPNQPKPQPPILPTVPGGQPLPEPGEGPNSSEGNAPQSLYLSIVSFSEAPNQRDVGKTPPKPKDGKAGDGIELDPVTRGCERLSFQQEQWVYRVRVNTAGQVEKATVWTDRISRPMSQEERAIACLIENAGFEFEPALFDGEPILDDNLLLTINLIQTR